MKASGAWFWLWVQTREEKGTRPRNSGAEGEKPRVYCRPEGESQLGNEEKGWSYPCLRWFLGLRMSEDVRWGGHSWQKELWERRLRGIKKYDGL